MPYRASCVAAARAPRPAHVAAAVFVLLLAAVARPAMAQCGNGVIEGPTEECDPGGGTFIYGDPARGACTSGGECFFRYSCCKFNCQFVGNGPPCKGGECRGNGQCVQEEGNCVGAPLLPPGAACGDPTSTACTAPDTCDGSGSCLPNHVAAGTACGDQGTTQCTAPDTCTGGGQCAPNDAPAGTPAGVLCNDGNLCTADQCNGSGGCANPPTAEGEVCRSSAGLCDVAERCSGGICAGDGFQPAGTVCRGAAGACDVGETCTGSSAACPADAFMSSTTVCRPSEGDCDPAEKCTGAGPSCPGDAKSTAECRPAVDVCDQAESCDGVNNACPPDTLKPSGAECRASAGACDPAESCTGAGPSCPADAKSTDVCRPVAGACDVPESCDGASNDCPADSWEPAGLECRPSAGVCDPAESCTGAGPSCPADTKSAAECRPAVNVCDVAESCDGVGDACPPDALRPAGVECRPAEGPCDAPETCTGGDTACPADVCEPGGTPCDDGNPCTGLGVCDGVGIGCAAGTPIVCPACEACDGFGGCTIGPLGVCRDVTGRKAKLVIKNRTPDDRDVLAWKFNKLTETELADLGNPMLPSNPDYSLCIFENADPSPAGFAPALVGQVDALAGDTCEGEPCWREIPEVGFRYKRKQSQPRRVLGLSARVLSGQGKVNVRARGNGLPNPPPALALPVVVQFQTGGACWHARYHAPKVNANGVFKGLAE